jgi:16S rRNA (cytosine1402-N4)-methyltransferase
MSEYHKPVLLEEVIRGLQVKQGGRYIDGTLGGGGHTVEILALRASVLGIDVDQDALSYVQKRSKELGQKITENLTVIRGNFKDIDRIAKEEGFDQVNGILLDLGVSSFQLDKAEKGFSFLREGPLDMRMDQTLEVRAADLVNGLNRTELEEVFRKFGEERNAKKIAQTITIERQFKKIQTTIDLVSIIEKAYGVTNEILSPKRRGEISMRVFQALRIAVNDELGVLRDVLPKALVLVKPQGRLVVITFHSLEDRIVKQAFLDFERKKLGRVITKKPLVATEQEMKENSRSRSAKLRIFEKTS